MKTYNKSILDYEDVRRAVDYARKEGIEIGKQRSIEKGREEERIRSIKVLYENNVSIEKIAKIFGYAGLTEEQIHRILNNE